MYKIVVILLVVFPMDLYACFSGEGYEVNYDKATLLLLAVLGISIVSMSFRLVSNKQRLWVPFLLLSTYMYFPFYLIMKNYKMGSDCGYGFLEASYIALVGSSLILIYELIYFYRSRK